MSGLLFLSTDDFYIAKGTNGNIMCTSIPGFSMLLFYSTQCEHCAKFLPIFKRINGTIGGCQFGIVNLGANKRLISMSKETIAPITFVPYIILYVNSKPFLIYRGPPDVNEIRRFIIEVSTKIQNKQKFSDEKDNKIQEQVRGKIPQYTIGIPLFGEDEDFYKEFTEAYTAEKKKQGGGNLFGQNDSRSMQANHIQRTVQNNRR